MRDSHSFLDFFPPPEMLSMPATGFDISDRAVRFAELRRHGTTLRLAHWGRVALPEDAVLKGELKNAETVRDILSGIAKENDIRFVRLALPEQLSYVVSLVSPRLSGRTLRESIALQLPEHIPFDPAKTIFDYAISDCNENKNDFTISVTATNTDTIAQYTKLFTDAGITILSVETESWALKRSLLSATSDRCATRMVLDIGATKTSLFVESGGIILLTSTIPIGGDTLAHELSRTLAISFDEAIRRKEAIGVGTRRILKSKEDVSVTNALLPIASSLAEEIKKYYVYWNTHTEKTLKKTAGDIEEIIISGGEANDSGFAELLENTLKKPIVVGNPWMNIANLEDHVPEIPKRELPGYAVVLGLALRSFE